MIPHISTTVTPDDLRPPLRDARHAALLARHIVGSASSGVVVIMLDDAGWPIGNFVIDGAEGRRALLAATDLLVTVAVDAPHLARVVLVDVRSQETCDPDDLDVLLDMSTSLDTLGVCLVELIVLTAEMYVPIGAVSGLPSRW